MQALKSLLRKPAKQTAKTVAAPAAGKPTPLTPGELKVVAGGLPKGTWAVNNVSLDMTLELR